MRRCFEDQYLEAHTARFQPLQQSLEVIGTILHLLLAARIEVYGEKVIVVVRLHRIPGVINEADVAGAQCLLEFPFGSEECRILKVGDEKDLLNPLPRRASGLRTSSSLTAGSLGRNVYSELPMTSATRLGRKELSAGPLPPTR